MKAKETNREGVLEGKKQHQLVDQMGIETDAVEQRSGGQESA